MAKQSLTWREVDNMAVLLGASEVARLKWRQRCVPSVWRIRMYDAFHAMGRPVEWREFDELPVTPGRIAV